MTKHFKWSAIVSLILIVSIFAMTIVVGGVSLAAPATVMAENFDCSQGRHDFQIIRNVPPTHTENGYIIYRCRLCGLEYRETVFATGHNWSDWVVDRAPTCTESGVRRRTCYIGTPHSETEEIPATGHSFVERVIEPTCTQPGQRIFTCSVCGYSYTETFGEPTGHNYIETITREPTCEHEGELTFTCEHCGESYTETIPKLEHIYGEWIIYIPAGEGTEGSKYMECILCGYRIWETIPALPMGDISQSEPDEPEREPLFGIEEVIIVGANIAAWVILFLLLSGEFTLLSWERKRKKELLAAKRFDENGEDGYEYI